MESEFGTFCDVWCGSRILCSGSAALLSRQCRGSMPYFNFSDERDDLLAAHTRGRLSHSAYLELARGHRFCLVVRGDMPGAPSLCMRMCM